ncbi:tRNA uridine-5-carboxymethylaminomethyl(34) synthesis GTPase MnmE [Sinanaerobacter sp. ZZT-01]|uniref:tRNA uridine-5-carboxymethylaminomethyl(34) synthesis GTPase MnmE n=1 Tax=Sinanaerobacter sp. ZZT-01 TaxID=3111540 RepID=UPI002D774DFD|nr:tRNA uridine-5-carboxymethylaminomethyl(34) synthesis GTPase MnmE [Sinanaerobacter sp. ZZT-01]WRR94759.1 tRNA uridine-5-carboxymethylaminomethyl(34) synthesis GTPase MnmE [Sinanaerobacter sp. ZZT-01]
MEDTIAAIATAFGEGGIGIIRMSGEKSKDILNQIFIPISKKNSEQHQIVNRRLTYGIVIDPQTNQTIDEVMAVFMKAPYTYTMEDIAEIHCHGSSISLQKTLALVLRFGARLAEKGEFTKRAFLNGRLDLSQAEAVIDLIKAKTDKSFQVALSQMEGELSSKIKEIRSDLMDILVQIAVNLDYPDEDIEVLTYKKQEESLLLIGDKIDKLLSLADTGRMLRDGIAVTIIGKPNVGKSSLMNAFLRESRAIVTEIPGTTRDIIEESMSVRGIPIRLTDTAGIHETDDIIEKIGIEKSKQSFNQADLIIFMLDASQPLMKEDLEIANYIGERKTIVLINKTDLEISLCEKEIKRTLPGAVILYTSMKNETGLNELEEEIEKMVYGGDLVQKNSMMVTNVRHKELLLQAKQSINDALKMIKKMEAMDFIEVDIKRAWELLGEMIGETVSEDIINEVFSRFCLGK